MDLAKFFAHGKQGRPCKQIRRNIQNSFAKNYIIFPHSNDEKKDKAIV